MLWTFRHPCPQWFKSHNLPFVPTRKVRRVYFGILFLDIHKTLILFIVNNSCIRKSLVWKQKYLINKWKIKEESENLFSNFGRHRHDLRSEKRRRAGGRERPKGTETILNLKPDTNQRHSAHQAAGAHVVGRYPLSESSFFETWNSLSICDWQLGVKRTVMSNANNANPTFPSKSKAPVAVVFFIIIHSAYVGNIYRNGCFLSPWSRRLLTPCKIFSAWVVAKNF